MPFVPGDPGLTDEGILAPYKPQAKRLPGRLTSWRAKVIAGIAGIILAIVFATPPWILMYCVGGKCEGR